MAAGREPDPAAGTEAPGAKPFRSLATLLVRRTIGVAIACTVLAAGVQAVFAVSEERKAFDRDLEAIAATHIPIFSVALWDIEPEAVRRQLAQVVAQPGIAYARLDERTGHAFEAGDAAQRGAGSTKSLRVPYPQGRDGTIATLEITPDRAALRDRLVERILVLLAGYGLLALAVCLVIYGLLRAELERPMRHLAQFTGDLTPERLTIPFAPPRKPRPWRDEFDLVAEGFRTLQDGIHAHVANLDAQVAIRTAQLEAALEENRALTITDPLTGCFNRRHLDARLSEEVLRVRRSGQPLSVVVADIDRFKDINDSRGHAAGDAVLRQVAELLTATMRERVDWVARFGGEEFVIVLPDTRVDAAAAIAERLRASVERTGFAHEVRAIRVTASFGVAECDESDDASSLLARADTMLYQAKAAGRNRVAAIAETIG